MIAASRAKHREPCLDGAPAVSRGEIIPSLPRRIGPALRLAGVPSDCVEPCTEYRDLRGSLERVPLLKPPHPALDRCGATELVLTLSPPMDKAGDAGDVLRSLRVGERLADPVL